MLNLFKISLLNPFPKNTHNCRKSRIELEQSILPMSTMELGLIEIEKGNFEEAKALLESAEKDFSGYLAENFVHLKVYAAYRRMGHNTDKQQEDKERCKWENIEKRNLTMIKNLNQMFVFCSKQAHPQLAQVPRD